MYRARSREQGRRNWRREIGLVGYLKNEVVGGE